MKPGAQPVRVVFRADASRALGTGHVTRCLTLAEELRARGASTRFLCRQSDGNLIERIAAAGHPVAGLRAREWRGDSSECTANLPEPADWLVIDHYELGIEWESALRPHVRRILCIEDLTDRRHDCDVLLDQNWRGPNVMAASDRAPAGASLLLGPRFALLQPQYAKLRSQVPARAGRPARVLVYFGGSDSTNETAKSLRALAHPDLRHLAVDVVLGPNHPAPDQIVREVAARARTQLHRALPTLAGLMSCADLAIGSGGATSWERLCLGLPSIVTTAARNQVAGTQALAAAGQLKWLGDAAHVSPTDYELAIRDSLEGPAVLEPLVDGLGAPRVAECMLPTATTGLSLRRAQQDDAEHLFFWRNDSLARAMSFSSEPIAWADHLAWFRRQLAADGCLLFVAEAFGLPVGQIRFDVGGTYDVLSYSLDPLVRGRGWSQWLIMTAIERAARPLGRKMIAEVKPENDASRRVFARLGWQAEPVDGKIRFHSPAAQRAGS